MQNSAEIPVVFLVDDNLEFAYLIERYCLTCGCQMWHFAAPAEALEKMHQILPQVLLLNLTLSSGDIQKLIEVIKRDRQLKHIPIIAFSSLRDDQRDRSDGTDYFLLKPIMYTDFLTTLRTAGVLLPAA